MRLLSLSHFAEIFAPLRGRHLGYLQAQYGNAGDALLHRATLQLFAEFGLTFTILNEPHWPRDHRPAPVPREIEHLVLFAGGSMGAPLSGHLRALARQLALPTTLLPQSWRAPEDAPCTRVFVREAESQRRFCPHATLVPDLALALDVPATTRAPDQHCGLFLRRDEEARFPAFPGARDPAPGLSPTDPTLYLHRASRYATLITDRLHFAICGLIHRRRVILLPGSYHKQRGVYEYSLRALDCEWAETPDAALRML